MDETLVTQEVHAAVFNAHYATLNQVMQYPAVKVAVAQARNAGISLIAIIMALLPFVAQILSGQPINIQAMIDAILALFVTK